MAATATAPTVKPLPDDARLRMLANRLENEAKEFRLANRAFIAHEREQEASAILRMLLSGGTKQ